MLRLLPLSLFLLVLTAAAHTQAQHVERVEIVDWGIYRTDHVGKVAAPLSPTGNSNLVSNVRLQHATTTVPALVGMKFGFHYTVVGSPHGARAGLKLVVRFPSQGLTNPAKSKTFFTAEYDSNSVVGGTAFQGFALDYDWEVEPGPWTLEIWHEGRKLAEKTFLVTRLVSSANSRLLRSYGVWRASENNARATWAGSKGFS